MTKIALLALVISVGCGSSTKSPATPPAPAPPSTPPVVQPVPDDRCTAPQQWVQPGCGTPTAFEAGCFTVCAKPGATSAERMNQSACDAGFTCTQVERYPEMSGVAAVCGTEEYLCLPAT